MVADLTKGRGRFNVTQGMLNTAIGVGAGLSNVLARFVVKSASHNVSFLILAAIDSHSISKFVDTSWVTVLVYR